MDKKKILLLSGYDAASHQYWRKLLADNLPQYQWTQIALADRYFSWRVRGSGFSFATEHAQALNQDYDLIIVTSMLDLNSLLGFVPSLAKIPCIVYFHENQFVYPIDTTHQSDQSLNQANLINAQVSSIFSALCADHLVFNSNYNLTSFLLGVKNLLKRLPEVTPKAIIQKLESKSDVIAVPIEVNDKNTLKNKTKNKSYNLSKFKINQRDVEILWNHRWEYDKQPEIFFDAIRLLKQKGYQFKIHVLGQSFRNIPLCFAEAEIEFAQEIESFGFQPKSQYLKLLNQADIVVSSALHDFQGLSLLEAINHGCVPIAPNRVAYPEYVDPELLYSVDGLQQTKQANGEDTEAFRLFSKLSQVIDQLLQTTELSNPVTLNKHQLRIKDYSATCLIPRYQALIEKACS
jgi:glycosyltransferase involved in cell wall biosynthesis